MVPQRVRHYWATELNRTTQKFSPWRIYPSLCSLLETATTSLPIMPMTALRIFPAPGDNNELIFIIIPPWVPVHSSQPYACFRYMGVKSEKKSSLIFLFSRYVVLSLCALSVVTLWGEDEWNRSEVVRGTDDSRVIMTSRKAAQGLLQLHARHSSRGHHKDVL